MTRISDVLDRRQRLCSVRASCHMLGKNLPAEGEPRAVWRMVSLPLVALLGVYAASAVQGAKPRGRNPELGVKAQEQSTGVRLRRKIPRAGVGLKRLDARLTACVFSGPEVLFEFAVT